MNLVKSPLALAISASLLIYSTQTIADNKTGPLSNEQLINEQLINEQLINEQLINEQQSNEQNIETITVTGSFRQTNLQKIPSSVSVLTIKDIEQRNAQNLEEIIAITPNVNFASGSQRARYYQIRGIGERSQYKEPINPSVGLLIDGIDFSGIGSIASTFDVAQTEIFRGPQGTRFGANAMAGLINITTNEPSDDFESSLRLTAGNYNSFGAGIVLSGPANDAIKYRVAIEQYQSDGFIENTYLNESDTNNRDELTMRGKLAIEASEFLTIDLTLFHLDFDNGFDAFSLDNTRDTFSDEPGVDQQETSALGSKFTYTGFNAFQLIALLSYADSDLSYGYDEDWSNSTLCQVNDCPYGDYSSTDYYFRQRSSITAEARLVSNDNAKMFNDTTAWLVGFYAKQDNDELQRIYTYDSDYASEFKTNNLAIFAELNTALNKKLSLITGIRFEQRQADFTNSDLLSFDPTDNMVGGKLVLSYQRTDDTLYYASINRGYKTGGINTAGSLTDDLRQFDPEYVVNYELGYKVSFLQNQAYLRAAVFYMNRDDVQINTSVVDVRDDGSSEFISYIDNAISGTNKGIELDGAWQINDMVELYGALGLLDTEFSGYTNPEGDSLSGREQAHAPKYQFNIGVNYQPSADWLVNVSYDGKDEFYFSDSHHEKSQPVELLNASVSYLAENWQVKVWARNMLDEDYATRGFNFGNDPRDGYSAKSYYQYGEPAAFGATLDYQF